MPKPLSWLLSMRMSDLSYLHRLWNSSLSLWLSLATWQRKLISHACIQDLVFQSESTSNNHRWGMECRSASNLVALPFSSFCIMADWSNTLNIVNKAPVLQSVTCSSMNRTPKYFNFYSWGKDSPSYTVVSSPGPAVVLMVPCSISLDLNNWVMNMFLQNLDMLKRSFNHAHM